ncbi:MAG: N-methyl-L-tryptophan oxidase [Anaerolineae bacterium]|nr:N-methyl-L-tryptophan oxidase [Phycisphaerae bacterium]
MHNGYDVIVIGVGGMGSSTCYELARRGVRVLGLEQFGIAHDRGSSHGYTRMIRLAYYEHADYVPMLRRAYEKWREIETVSGEKILHITGGIYAGASDGELVPQSANAAREYGIEHETLDRAEIAKRFPQLLLPNDFIGLFEPAAGFVRPELAVSTFVRHAMLAGAEIHVNEPVLAWSAEPNAISVTTDVATYTADRVIFTAGPWTSKLVRDLGIPLVVTRQVLGWVQPNDSAPFGRNRFACWAIEQPDESLYYGAPLNDFEPGLKIAHHKPGPPTDPDDVSRDLTPTDERAVQRIVTDVLPSAAGAITEMRVCLYTNSPDSHFIIGEHPNDSRILLACGFSGHGFKFASVMGEVMCDLATKGRTTLPIEFLSPTRFRC